MLGEDVVPGKRGSRYVDAWPGDERRGKDTAQPLMAQPRCDRLLDNVLAGLGERGDVLWQLASTGDLVGLRAAAHRVEDWSRYAKHRARAFALALEGLDTAALDELNRGWDGAWPPVSVYATDAAQIHFLAGDPDRALATLALGVRGARRLPVGARVLLAGCV